MGKAPAVIIIARHGARLDGEDKTWHLNSPTPYDTPLSYGGWTQTRALGARIGSLLHARDITLSQNENHPKRRGSESAATPDFLRPLQRRHRVIFHSSPFLRCIQTSIAINAGIAQYEGNLAKFETQHFGNSSRPPRPPQTRAFTLDDKSIAAQVKGELRPPRAVSSNSSAVEPPMEYAFAKPLLRIDAFLGEWLSADYFEFITPPPSSSMMVAGAKADLLRPATPILGSSQAEPLLGKQGSNWMGHRSSVEGSSMSVSDLIESLPASPKPDADDKTVARMRSYPESSGSKTLRLDKNLTLGYTPPTPEYALSTNQAIPRGYVAHARDACTNVDFQWDSMRAPQLWGDGGEFSEEWTWMHRRFRKGLMDMISWYKEHGPDRDPQNVKEDESSKTDAQDENEEEDVVLIIVTHGAGCNALIGALTNQPVLMDVGMASLTMAVRKDKAELQADLQRRRRNSGPRRRENLSIDTSQSEEYEVKLTASTEHLRAGANPLEIPQLQQPPVLMPSISEVGDSNSFESPNSQESTDERPATAKNSALGSIRKARAATLMGRALSGVSGSASPTSMPSSPGLWGGSDSSSTSSRRNSIHHRGQFQPKALTFDASGKGQNSPDLSVSQAATSKSVPFSPSPAGSVSESTTPKSNTRHGLWSGGLGARKEPRRRWTFADNS